jgi:hypothetical protein
MLDVGGSHGLSSAALCGRHPELYAEILDLPDAVAQAAPSNLLHHFDSPQSRAVIRRAAGALRPGGILVIQELFTPASGKEAGLSPRRLVRFAMFPGAGQQNAVKPGSWRPSLRCRTGGIGAHLPGISAQNAPESALTMAGTLSDANRFPCSLEAAEVSDEEKFERVVLIGLHH